MVLCAAACGASGHDPLTPRFPVPGVYALQTVNGSRLPITGTGLDSTISVYVADTLTLAADQTLAHVQTFRHTPPGGQTTTTQEHETGRWSATDSVITARFDASADTETGTFTAGSTLTLIDNFFGDVFVYRK
ncbi:hypothetical protein tb265_49870 [Gemmatimonadetes bacterium T265]|nr:hypothetical protein tb265_49870 [Gemmatimonadetes bacterium T265]